MQVFGFTIGFLAAAIAIEAVGTLLLLGKGYGLLMGDRRVWWLAACLLGYIISHYGFLIAQPLKPEHNPMRDAAMAGQQMGGIAGAVIVFVIGMVLLRQFGQQWASSNGTLSAAMSIIVLVGMVVLGANIARSATTKHQHHEEKLDRWSAALKERDHSEIRTLAKDGKGEWNYVPGLQCGPLIYAHRQQDTELYTTLFDLHPNRMAAADLGVGFALEDDTLQFLTPTLERMKEDQAFIDRTLCLVVMNGTPEMFDLLLNQYKADPNAVHLQSALMMAVHQGRPAIARELVQRGAKVNYLHQKGTHIAETALHSAVYYAPELVEWLLAAGADVNLCHEGSFTPLMRAVDKRRPEVIALLIESGADIDAKNEDGDTAPDLAMSLHGNNASIISLLSQ